MLKFQTKLTALALTGLFAVSAAQAAVSPQEAAKLGTSLTEFGAEKAGNAAGTIPAYTGGLTKAPMQWRRVRWHLTKFRDRPFTWTRTPMH